MKVGGDNDRPDSQNDQHTPQKQGEPEEDAFKASERQRGHANTWQYAKDPYKALVAEIADRVCDTSHTAVLGVERRSG